MEVLQYLKHNKWIPLYIREIQNRCRRDKNLADLNDTDVARENLGLTGEVSTHTHNSLYVTKGENDRRISELESIVHRLAKEKDREIAELKELLAEKFGYLNKNTARAGITFVGDNPPLDPIEGCIWFCTLHNQVHVKAFKNGVWISAGGVWQ